jgi:hypothetical protein
MTEAPSRWDRIRTFCLFVGYGRSGHSAVASLIDAHPHAVIAHEFHAVRHFFRGVPRDVLFQQIVECAQEQARLGRHSPKAGGGSYSQRVEGQRKETLGDVTVIGDKKGAGTCWQLARRGVHRIEDFKGYIGVPVKILHVVRNPFDVIAGGRHARGESRFAELAKIVSAIRQRCSGPDWLDVHHEDLIAAPREEMARMLEFLGLPVFEDHLQHCEAHLYTSTSLYVAA